MRDQSDRVVYYVFFATNNPLGHIKMKESMWKVDPMGDFRFSDATDPDQQVLFSEPQTARLASDLKSHFHAEPEKAGDLAVADRKADGKKRRAGTYPNDALIRFTASA